jgi:hypothetical protein
MRAPEKLRGVESDFGPAAGAVGAKTRPPWEVTMCSTIASPSPVPGCGSGFDRTVEALEHMWEVGLGNSRSPVPHATRRPSIEDLDRLVRRRPLGGVVDEVRDRSLQLVQPARHGSALAGHRDGGRSPGRVTRRQRSRPARPDRGTRLVAQGRVCRQVDEFGGQVGSCGTLGQRRRQQLPALIGGELGTSSQQRLEVGDGGGERGPELVSGVGDSRCPAVRGSAQRRQHPPNEAASLPTSPGASDRETVGRSIDVARPSVTAVSCSIGRTAARARTQPTAPAAIASPIPTARVAGRAARWRRRCPRPRWRAARPVRTRSSRGLDLAGDHAVRVPVDVDGFELRSVPQLVEIGERRKLGISRYHDDAVPR